MKNLLIAFGTGILMIGSVFAGSGLTPTPSGTFWGSSSSCLPGGSGTAYFCNINVSGTGTIATPVLGGTTITTVDEANEVTLIINQEDVTNNPSGIVINNDGTGNALLVDTSLTGTAAAPSLAFGDGDSGLYENAENSLKMSIGGGNVFTFNSGGLSLVQGAKVVNELATATNPNFAPNFNDDNTGIGFAGVGQLSLIAGGIEGMRINTATTGVNYLDITPSATTDAVQIATGGTDTNINLSITPKGTGVVGIGTATPLMGDDGTNILDIGGSTQVNSLIDPVVSITGDNNAITAVQLQNVNTGAGAEMRFITAADNSDYLAFTAPGENNTGTFFGITRGDGVFSFSPSRDYAVGTTGAFDYAIGTNDVERMRILSTGEVGIGTDTPNATLTINGSQSIKRTDTGAGDYNPSALTTDHLITTDCTASARAVTISSEDVAAGTTANPRIFSIKDEYGCAGSNAITITLEGGGDIDGTTSAILNGNYDAIDIYCTGTNCFIK